MQKPFGVFSCNDRVARILCVDVIWLCGLDITAGEAHYCADNE